MNSEISGESFGRDRGAMVVESTEDVNETHDFDTQPPLRSINTASLSDNQKTGFPNPTAPSYEASSLLESFRKPSRGISPLQSQSPTKQLGKRQNEQFPIIMLPPAKYQRLPYSTSRTGFIYDVRMRFHVDPSPEAGDDAHPEQPRRIFEIYEELVQAGLAPDIARPENDNDFMMVRLPIRQATPEEIGWIHDPEYVDTIRNLAGADLSDLKERTEKGESIYFHNLSWLCASLAAGGAIVATEAVVSGRIKNSVAIIRPPGHHAEHAEATGFCFFNNVCIAARAAQKAYPETCRKILILDWDVHHGNGVQRAFYEDPNILYISLHVYRDARFYPFSDFADHLHCGAGDGVGRNVNIPWQATGMTDADYIMAFQQVVMPIATEFNPDLVLISAGFDAAEGDPLGECRVTPAGYAHMTHMLMQLAHGKVVACLEGGYNLRSIAVSALAMTKTLMGEPPDRLVDLDPTPSAVSTIQRVIRTQSRYWKTLYPKDLDMRRRKELGAERLHDMVRELQAHWLWEQHQMTSLYILRTRVSRSFQNQVLATPNFNERRPMLVLFHDPPEALGFPDPRTAKVELHNTFLTDVAKTYVDWAVKQGFSVVDVNVPRHITEEDDEKGYVPPDEEPIRSASTRELAYYLWDNYIDVSEKTHVFLLGIGDAYSGILDLLSQHPSAEPEINLTVCFVAEHILRSVQKPSDDSVSLRYYQRSLIYVSPHHLAFDPSRSKKLKRRFGNVIKSSENELQYMLQAHFGEVTERMLEETEDWRNGAQAEETDGEMGASDAEDELAKGTPAQGQVIGVSRAGEHFE